MNAIDTLIHIAQKNDFTIAIIDAESSMCIRLEKLLHQQGCSVLHAIDADEIPSVLKHKPDFLIIDPATIDRFDLYGYMNDPYGAGVVILTSDTDPQQRNTFFELGVLDIFSKNDPLESTVKSLLRLFNTIDANTSFHISIISRSEILVEKLKRMIFHRNYSLCVVSDFIEVAEKWDHSEHELPDLLLLHLDEKAIDSTLELVNEIRRKKISEVPIIILSEPIEPNIVSRFYREGVNEIIELPYSAEKLFLQITSHLDYRIDRHILNYEKNLSMQIKTMIDSKSIVSKTDPRGIITYVNEGFVIMSGYRADELIGKPHNIIRHPDNSPLIFKEMWETIRKRKIFRGIIRNRRKDGTSYYVDSMITPIIDDNDKIVEYISIRHDITELIEKQHELENQRQRVQNVLDAQTSLICMVDKAKGIMQSNAGFMEFLGITSLEPDICGFHHLFELFLDTEEGFRVHEGERYVWLERLYDMRGKFIKVAMEDPFGNPHIFAIHVEKIADARFSEGICYLVSFEDVSELSRALRDAQLASEAESRFLATMSHEIRTPLNGILGFTELLRDTPLGEEQKKYLEAIDYSGETLRQIINDILEVMKLDHETLELNPEPINLIREFEAIVYPFYAHAAKKGVELLVYIDPKLPVTLHADILRIKQILINLINNAIKFTPRGKNVCVRISKINTGPGHVTIGFIVADEGIGIKSEHKESIFNAFVQADNTIAREFGGTGLGLNIVARIIKAMGGEIAFKSTPGQGSLFYTKLRFTCDDASFQYFCRKKTNRLFLPFPNLSVRLKLLENYLKHFQCCNQEIHRTSRLEDIEDRSDTNVILCMEMMSTAEIVHLTQRFKEANLYILPSSVNVPFLPLQKPNVTWLPYEVTWSNIVKALGIYNPESITKFRSQEEPVVFKGVRVLVAEDNEVNRFLIDEILKKLGIKSDMAHDGYEAVQKFKSGTYDMVLMDINMPNLDGISAANQIIRYEEDIGALHTPIIGLSADAVAKNITRYIRHGLDGYLIKPLRQSELVKLLKELFGGQKLLSPSNVSIQKKEISTCDISLLMQIASKLELPHEIIRELFRKFITNTQTLLQQLKGESDPAELKTTIHSLKGIAKNLYLDPLGSDCSQFEADLSTLDEPERHQRIEKICNEAELIISQMEQELNT